MLVKGLIVGDTLNVNQTLKIVLGRVETFFYPITDRNHYVPTLNLFLYRCLVKATISLFGKKSRGTNI